MPSFRRTDALDGFPVIEIDSNRRHRFRLGRPVWTIVALLVLSVGPAMARSSGYPPDGLPVGRWVLAPYVATQVGVEDNLFRLNS
jgi:hypothetical protein